VLIITKARKIASHEKTIRTYADNELSVVKVRSIKANWSTSRIMIVVRFEKAIFISFFGFFFGRCSVLTALCMVCTAFSPSSDNVYSINDIISLLSYKCKSRSGGPQFPSQTTLQRRLLWHCSGFFRSVQCNENTDSAAAILFEETFYRTTPLPQKVHFYLK
jgi:hypothetical protein